MIWDDKAIARLAELVATGVSYTTIGMKMHISKNAAIGKARRLNLQKSPASSTPIKYKKSVYTPKPPKPAKRKPIQTKIVLPTSPQAVPVADMQLVTMMQLKDEHCRYPIDNKEEMLFCGRLQDGIPPYCADHSKICYMPPREPILKTRRDQSRGPCKP